MDRTNSVHLTLELTPKNGESMLKPGSASLVDDYCKSPSSCNHSCVATIVEAMHRDVCQTPTKCSGTSGQLPVTNPVLTRVV